MAKYYANMTVNNGTHLYSDIEGTNKFELLREIRDIAQAECFAGSECHWKVWDENGVIVLAGAAFKNINNKFTYLFSRHWIGEKIH